MTIIIIITTTTIIILINETNHVRDYQKDVDVGLSGGFIVW